MNTVLSKLFTLPSLLVVVFLIKFGATQHETIPYAAMNNICQKCHCQTANDYQKMVFILNCQQQNLQHILPIWPPEFGKNHSGVEIQVTFSDNHIELLQQLPLSSGIIHFSCRNCNIKEIQAPTFIDCPNIQRLDLSYNQLDADSLNPDIFRGPYNETVYQPIGLEELDLRFNQIRSLDARLFEHIPNLKRLYLAGNTFDTINSETMNSINSAKMLQVLDLSYCNIKNLPDDLFKQLNSLHSLFLQGNFLQMIPCELKTISKSLQALDLSGNEIKKFDVSSFDELTKLRFLNVSSMKNLNVIEDGTFSALKNLEQLICNNNKNLTSFHLPTSSQNLRKLDISNCNIKHLILDVDILHSKDQDIINYWPQLIVFHLFGNPWTCDCSLVKIFHKFSDLFVSEDETIRCSLPYNLAGENLKNVNILEACERIDNVQLKPSDSTNFKTPYFLRPRSIAITVMVLIFAVTIGIVSGFGIVCVRQRLKKNIFFINTGEIRYTTVRNV